MTLKQRAWQTFYEPKCGKPVSIVVWKNKDYDVPGQQVTLHSQYMKSWNSVLNFLTVVLQPRFGAIRKLYHLGSRKLVLCLQDIKSNEKYVAVGSDKFKFKKNGYLTKEEKRSSHVTKSMSNSNQIGDHAACMENFMAYTKKKDRTVVYFMVSGRACQMPLKVVLIRSDFLDYNMILDYLSYRLDIGEGIHYLCNTKGKIISNLNHLKHGQLYIAVPFLGRFTKLDYPRLFADLMPQPLLKVDKLKGGRKKKQKILELKESLKEVEVTPEEPREMSHVDMGASSYVTEKKKQKKLEPKDSVQGIEVTPEKPKEMSLVDMGASSYVTEKKKQKKLEPKDSLQGIEVTPEEPKEMSLVDMGASSYVTEKKKQKKLEPKDSLQGIEVTPEEPKEMSLVDMGASSYVTEKKKQKKLEPKESLKEVEVTPEEPREMSHVDMGASSYVTEKKKQKKLEPKDRLQGIEVTPEEPKEMSHVDMGASSYVTEKKKQKKLEPKDRLQGIEVTPEEPKEMSHVDMGASSYMNEKCISSKCLDKECRLFKDEYSSKPGSIVAAERKSTIQGSSLGRITDTNWEAYRADFMEKIDELVIDVNAVRELLNDLVDKSITMAISRGIAFADVSSDAFRDQENDTSDSPLGDNNMTTFADLAKEKHLSEPIFGFDLPVKQARPESSMSSVYKKSVSFMNNAGNAEMLYEAPESLWPYSRPISLESMPKATILKIKEETTSKDPMQTGQIMKRSRDSIYKTREVAKNWSVSLDVQTGLLEDDQEPTKYLDQILKETLLAEIEEEATEKQNTEPEEELSKLMEDEKMKDYTIEGDNELVEKVSVTDGSTSVGVQKGWKLDEDIKNKGVQSDQSENTSVFDNIQEKLSALFGSSNDDKGKKEGQKTRDNHVEEDDKEKVANAEAFLCESTSKTNGYEGNKKENWGNISFHDPVAILGRQPKVSILKVRGSDASQHLEEHKELPILLRRSFLGLRDSINSTDFPDIPHRLSALVVDDLADDDNKNIEEEEKDSLDNIQDEKKTLEDDGFSDEGDETAISRGIQKNWNANEEIIDKSIQANVIDVVRSSNAFFYSEDKDLSDIYENFEKN